MHDAGLESVVQRRGSELSAMINDKLFRRLPGLLGCGALCLLLGTWGSIATAGEATSQDTTSVRIESIRLEGAPALVFDYAKDQQEPDHLPDAPLAAWKEADGTVNLMIPHFENYRMRGPSLDQLENDPHKIFSSIEQANDIAENSYNYHHWLIAPYTLDGKTVYALSHTEWYACLLTDDCRSRDNILGGWTTTNNLFKSNDGGRSWAAQGNNRRHLVFNGANRWTGSRALAKKAYRRALNVSGFMVPSRIIREGNYFYTVGLETYRNLNRLNPEDARAPVERYGYAILRTRDISRAAGWEVWSGGNKYKPAKISNLEVFVPEKNGRPMRMAVPNIIYDLNARVYVLFFTLRGEGKGLYYITTASLASPSWSSASMVEGGDVFQPDPRRADVGNACNVGLIPSNYPSVIDAASPGWNFEFTYGKPWMYYTVNHARCGGKNLNRDVFRVRMNFKYSGPPR